MPSKSPKSKPPQKKNYLKLIFIWIILLGLLFSIFMIPLALGAGVAGQEEPTNPLLPSSPLPSAGESQASTPSYWEEGEGSLPTFPSQPGDQEPPSLDQLPGQSTPEEPGQETLPSLPGPSEDPTVPMEPEEPTLPLGPEEEDFPIYGPPELEYWPEEEADLDAAFEARPDRLTLLLPLDAYLDQAPRNAQGLNFNPLLYSSSYLFSLAGLLYRPLYSPLDQGAYSLLDSYELSPDGRSLHLELKPGLRWAENQPLTVKDLEFTLDCLIKAPQLYPRANFVEKILGVPAYWRRLAGEPTQLGPDLSLGESEGSTTGDTLTESSLGANPSDPQPFISLEGIQALNDLELNLYFSEDISDQLEDILDLPLLPARVWWSYPPQDWPGLPSLPTILAQENLQAVIQVLDQEPAGEEKPDGTEVQEELYAAAGAGPYSLELSSDSSDLVLKAKPAAPDSPLQAGHIPQLTIRYSREYELVEDLLSYQADIALLPLLSPEDQARILEAGYKLDKVATPETLSLLVNTGLEDNLLSQPEILTALYLLFPSGQDMQDLTRVPLLALQGEHLSGDQASLSQQAGLEAGDQQLSPADRRNLAWELLLEAGYTSYQMPEEMQAQAGETAQNLDSSGLTIFYIADDLLSYDVVAAWDEELRAAGLPLSFQLISQHELENGLASIADGLILNNVGQKFPADMEAYALYRQAYFFASKRVENFLPQSPYYFLGAENWRIAGEETP